MKYLLDTNICIYIINERPQHVLRRFLTEKIGDIGISSISAAELAYGIAKSGSEKNQQALAKFLSPLEISSFGEDAFWQYGTLRALLESLGTPIGSLDTLIAAHALALGATLVTNNTREFERVPNLHLENWA
jgi:tRNA(fMet)-specific endonuclease VapC